MLSNFLYLFIFIHAISNGPFGGGGPLEARVLWVSNRCTFRRTPQSVDSELTLSESLGSLSYNLSLSSEKRER